MNEQIREVFNDHLKGLKARHVWGNPEKEIILNAVLTKLGQPLSKSGCLLCISEGLEYLNKKVYEGMKTRAKYKLKNVMVAKLGFKLTNDNLTDELARQLLRRSPELIKLFAKYPKGWERDIEPKPAKKEEKPEIEIEENAGNV